MASKAVNQRRHRATSPASTDRASSESSEYSPPPASLPAPHPGSVERSRSESSYAKSNASVSNPEAIANPDSSSRSLSQSTTTQPHVSDPLPENERTPHTPGWPSLRSSARERGIKLLSSEFLSAYTKLANNGQRFKTVITDPLGHGDDAVSWQCDGCLGCGSFGVATRWVRKGVNNHNEDVSRYSFIY